KLVSRSLSVGDDAFPSCPCTGGRDPRPQGRARRRRRVERARASRVCHRSAVAPQPATLSKVAQRGGDRRSARRALAGSAIVLFRPRSVVARLYSIAVAPQMGGRGVGAMLLAAAEAAAVARCCRAIRLEVHVTNHAAISRYRKSGYTQFARHRGYYEDGGDAL